MTAAEGPGDVPSPPDGNPPPNGTPPPPRIRRAAGIYGTIVTAAVLASAGGSLKSVPLALAVFVTLIVYWLAEEYAEIGEHASAGRLPSWTHVRSALAAKWPMVSASYIPLAVLLVTRAAGASTSAAAYTALFVTVVLLTIYGWTASRAAGYRAGAQVGMTLLAGGLGVVMIALKALLAHLH